MKRVIPSKFVPSSQNWLKPTSILFAAVICGVLGTILLARSHAASPVASIEAENGTLSSAASSINDTTASGSRAVKFGTGSSGGSTGSTAEPNASNTGVPAGTKLTVVTGDQTYSTDNQVISGLDIHGYVLVTGKNITIKDSIIRGGSKPCAVGNYQDSAVVRSDSGATGFVLEDSEISPTAPTACMDGVWAANTTLLRDNIHGATDGMKAANNTTVEDSYIHDMVYQTVDPNQGGGPTHNDGIQTFQCNSNILVQHNNIDMSTTTSANAAYQIGQDEGSPCSNIVVNGNWLDGGGCTINVAHRPLAANTGVSITNNRFGRHRTFNNCTVLLSTKTTLAAYSGNVWDDTGLAIPAPQVHD